MIPDSLRILQLSELKILIEFKRICEKLSLNYFLVGGTLLGAIRHHGFIPWDDDIDVGMLRSDFEKFITLAPSELGSEYFLQTVDTDSGYAPVYAKIRLNDTEFREFGNEHVLEHRGIFIDIFPFDNVPSSKFAQRILTIFLTPIERICMYEYSYRYPPTKSIIKLIYRSVLYAVSKIVPKKFILNLRTSVINHWNDSSTGFMHNWPFKITPTAYFDELIDVEFETLTFPAPKHYDEYLTLFYGDYMKIPPENERPKHSPYEPNFGKYAYIKTLDDVLPKKE